MESFVLFVMLTGLLLLGAIVGNFTSTNDIMAKQITEANSLCVNSEGLYKINSGNKNTIAFCKNNDKFDLKGEK